MADRMIEDNNIAQKVHWTQSVEDSGDDELILPKGFRDRDKIKG
jgi:hypothetical protein